MSFKHCFRNVVGFTAGLVILLSAVAYGQTAATLTIKATAGGRPNYTIENPYYRLLISSKEGGRILSFIDKQTGTDLTKDGGPGQNGGMLDDRQKFTSMPYASAIMNQSPRKATLRLSAHDDQGLEVVKILTFFADRPVIHLHYTFANGTQKPLGLWIRNFIELPGGIGKGKTDFFLSTEKGWQSIYASNYYRKLSMPWYGIIDRPTRTGFAYLANATAIGSFYFYHGGRTTTMEWLDRPLPAGQKAGASSRIVLLHGLSRLTLLSDRCAMGVAPSIDKDGMVHLEGNAISLDPSLKQMTLSAKATDAKGKTVHTWKGVTVQLASPDAKPTAVTLPPAKLPNGAYVITLAAAGKDFRYTSAPMPAHVNDKADLLVQTLKQNPRHTAPIQGWKSDADRFTITEAEKKAGFWISRGRNEGKARIDQIGLEDVLGGNETDAISFTINALRNLNGVPVTLKVTDPTLAPHVAFFQENEYKLYPLSRIDLMAGTEKRLWLMIDSKGLSPGAHEGEVELTLGDIKQRLPLKLTVYPVPLPTKNYLRIKGYVPFTSFTGGTNWKGDITERLARTVPLYAKMGGRVMNWTVNRYQILPHVLIKSTGQHLYGKKSHEPFSLDHLPDLDFSYFEPVWKAFVDNGVDQFDLYQNLYPDAGGTQTLINAALGKKSDVKPGTPEADRLRIWYYTQLHQAAEAAGFKRFFCKISDEFGPARIPAYSRMADVIRQAGYRPYSTMTGMIPRTPKAIEEINPHLEQWQLGFGSKEIFLDLIHNPYRVETRKVDIKAEWGGGYHNGSAKDTWGVAFFGRLVPQSLQDLVGLQILENGRPLKEKSGSPWGNTERGVFFTGGAYLYLSPFEGTPKDKTYTAVMKVRVPDANGRPLVKIDPSDEIWMYGGGTRPFRTPHNKFRQYGWIAAENGMQGFGVWAYWWWSPTERLVFYDDKTGATTLTPAYWGVRDGWEEGQYLAEAMDGMNPRQRQAFLKGIISTNQEASLRLVNTNTEIYHYLIIGNGGDPRSWTDAKQKVLEYLAHRQNH